VRAAEKQGDPIASDIKLFLVITVLNSTLLPKHKRQWSELRLALPHHGNFTPARISAGCPHCVIPICGGCDWTEVSL